MLRFIGTGDNEPAPYADDALRGYALRKQCPYCGGPTHEDDDDWCPDYHAYQRSIDPDYGDDTYECQ